GLPRAELAALGREYLLAGHLIDRAGMPYALKEFGLDGMRDIAIEEWMGASPVHTRRIREAHRFEGDDAAAIFKGMQCDTRAPLRRPPGSPAARLPRANWLVELVPAVEPPAEPDAARWLATSRAANVRLERPAEGSGSGGADEYAGAFEPDVRFDRFSHRTL